MEAEAWTLEDCEGKGFEGLCNNPMNAQITSGGILHTLKETSYGYNWKSS